MTAQLNDSLKALVVKNGSLLDDLMSANTILDLGYKVFLSHDGGIITNHIDNKTMNTIRDNKNSLPIIRSGSSWLVDLKRVQCLAATKPESDLSDRVLSLHRRLGHAPPKVMIDAIQAGSWANASVTAQDIRQVFVNHECAICAMGKRNNVPIPDPITDPRSIPIGDLISGDIIGPIDPPGRSSGAKYFFLFVDRRTSHLNVYLSKTIDGFLTALRSVYDFYVSHGHKARGFRSDSENIFVYGDIPAFLESQGVNQTFSLPYAHYQDLVERHVQTIVKMTSTTMHDQKLLGANFCDYCLYHSVSLKNATPNSKTDGLTPNQMINGKPPVALDRTFLFPFGSPILFSKP